MNIRSTIAYLESLISAYNNSNLRSRFSSRYRMIWMSSEDIESLKQAIVILKGEKYEKVDE